MSAERASQLVCLCASQIQALWGSQLTLGPELNGQCLPLSVDGVASARAPIHMALAEAIHMLRVAVHKLPALWVDSMIVDQTMIRQLNAIPPLFATTVPGAYVGVHPPGSQTSQKCRNLLHINSRAPPQSD